MAKKNVIAAIIERDGKFLLGKRSPVKTSAPGYWCPISGGVEDGESEEAAVAREVFEEVGLRVRATQKITSFDTHDRRALIHWWAVEILEGSAYLKNDEHSEIRWFGLDELKTLSPTFKEDVDLFEEFFRLLGERSRENS